MFKKIKYCKKIRRVYYDLSYNEYISAINEIAQKIIKANGFTKICN